MPRLFICMLCVITFVITSVYGEQTFPYKAYVTADGVEVLSGPGPSYYPTDKVQMGDIVEVYKDEPGGYCAIKPPEGSFTWISDRFLKLEDGNLAVVTEDDVATRVGSRLSNARDVIQVRMHKGETVEILGSREIPGSNSQIWYKIAPPSGEFRWISNKYLEGENLHDSARNSRLGDDATEQDTTHDRPDAESSGTSGKGSSAEFQAELDRLDMDLSMMVVEEPSAWSFDSMRLRGESLFDRADAAEDRGKARLLLNKIARFEDIKQRHQSVTALREQNAISNRFLDGLRRTMEKAAALADPEGQFDGVGQLQEVYSQKLGAPRYALLDETGNIRYYVTPAPGVNLQNYVGRQIGVTGIRGYMPEQKAQHITARHVTSLENRLR